MDGLRSAKGNITGTSGVPGENNNGRGMGGWLEVEAEWEEASQVILGYFVRVSWWAHRSNGERK